MTQSGTKLTTSNKVHDLDPIVVAQRLSIPLAPTDDFAIELDRDASGRQIKLGD